MDTEERTQKMQVLKTRWNTLSTKLTLDHLTSEITALNTSVETLPDTVKDLRKRGFYYHNDWEERVQSVARSWNTKRVQARNLLQRERLSIKNDTRDVDELLDKGRWSDSSVSQLENQLAILERQVGSAETNVRQFYANLQSDASKLGAEFRQAGYMLDSLADASFQLYSDEHGIAAVNAAWTSDKDEPDGILFLTENRMIFEQREKKAMKKVLFVTTKSELVQEKLWETPVGAIAEMSTEDKGFLKGKQFITFCFKERTRELPGDVTLQLKGMDNDNWMELVRDVQSGAITKDHVNFDQPEAASSAVTAPVAPPAAPNPADIPTQCPACGAKLPVAYRGVRELTCEYCGKVVYI